MGGLAGGFLLIAAIAPVPLMPGAASASANSSHSFNSGSRSGSVSNPDWSRMSFDPDFSLDFENPVRTAPRPLEFVRIPSLRFSLKMNRIPKTGDATTPSILWIGRALPGLPGIGGTLPVRKRGKGRRRP